MVTRCWVSAARNGSESGEPMVNSPAGTTTICGQKAHSLNAVSAPGTRQIAGGAARRCCGGSASSGARADATRAAVLALRSAIRASSFDPAGRASPCVAGARAIIAQTMSPMGARMVIVLDLLGTAATGSLQFRVQRMAGVADDPQLPGPRLDVVDLVGAAQI